ncbi:MAG: stage 0 sporulation family protein [Gemmatimonadota bacterium]
MTHVLEVRFKGNRREYYTWQSEDLLRIDEPVIVEVERGQDFGVVSAVGGIAEKKCQRCGACNGGSGLGTGDSGSSQSPAPSPESLRSILRRATPDDRKTATQLRENEEEIRRTVRDRVRQHNLPMKVSDAEWQWDKRKLTIYFTAEQRVDFRALVRDLAGLFRTRIELRQIGARDEAKRLDGIGRCGRQLCISSWLPEGRPVSLSLAKAQGLSLNPVQISGPCGRLLCCLHYEHDFYVQQRKRFPKEGKTVKTAEGDERVVSVDIFRERVTLRSEDGATRVVGLEQLRS